MKICKECGMQRIEEKDKPNALGILLGIAMSGACFIFLLIGYQLATQTK